MAISRFDEGTLSGALITYFSAAEGGVTYSSGSEVATITSVYGDQHPMTLTYQGATPISHDPATIKIGQMAAYDNPGSSTTSSLVGQFPTQLELGSTDITVVIVEQRHSASSERSCELVWQASSSNSLIQLTNSAGNYRTRIAQTNYTTSIAVDTNVRTMILECAQAANSSVLYDSDVTSEAITHPAESNYCRGLALLGGYTSGIGLNGKLALCTIYNRALTAQERADVIELCQHWITNGEAPSTYPPSGNFGTVETADDTEVTEWRWEESSDDTNWATVGTILTDTSGQGTPTLTVNSAPLAANGTYVRCKAFYNNGDDNTVSQSTQLTVV